MEKRSSKASKRSQGVLMSLHPESLPSIPEETARIARQLYQKTNRYRLLRDELGMVYTDEQFAALYPSTGQSAASPWRLALVLIMQFMENYTDRQAAEAVRSRIDWKYVLSLELTDLGFDFVRHVTWQPIADTIGI
jgi:transposase